MKKIIAAIVSLAFIASFALSVSADTITTFDGTATKPVTGSYQSGSAATVYSVDVTWGAMAFTYSAGSSGTWNPSDHSYTGGTSAGWSWSNESNRITVTNHSNAQVQATFAFAPSVTGVTGNFYSASTGGIAISGNAISLATAAGTTFANAPERSAYLQITGGSISADQTIGTISVTLG